MTRLVSKYLEAATGGVQKKVKHFAKFTRKHLCQSLFFNKVAYLRPVGTGVFL